MKYENPRIELLTLDMQEVIRTSSGLDDGDGNEYQVPGTGSSTSTSGKW